MPNAKNMLGLFVGMALCAGSAQAQPPMPATEKFFANVNIGGQLATRIFTSSIAQTVHSETATLVSSQEVGRGAVIDFGGGYRVWEDVFAGIVISRFGDSSDAGYTASIPHPVFFNNPRIAAGTVNDLKRSEVAVSPHVLWAMPLTDKIDVALAAGIAIIHLSQDLVGSFTVPLNTQDLTVIATTEKGTAVGPYVAADFVYNLPKTWYRIYGVGGYLRYAGAKVDLPSLPDAKVGGFQIGGGIRLRF
jgi:hypothetical protein